MKTPNPRYTRVLVDTGPLVAILNTRDKQHAVCTETLRYIQPPLFTCWPVLTEAAWLLRADASAVTRLLNCAALGLFQLLELSQDELPEIDKLYKRYHSLSPQLADITLVYLAQRENLSTIFTLDRRDFIVYRKGKAAFELLPPNLT